jgi:hypothetical protein
MIMDADMTMPDGTRVLTDGTIILADGTTLTLVEGEGIVTKGSSMDRTDL